SYSQSRGAVERVPPAGHVPGAGQAALRLPARRPEVRCAAARRHRARSGPLDDDASRHHQHPRRHRLPQEPEGARPDDWGAGAGGREAVEGTGAVTEAACGLAFGRQAASDLERNQTMSTVATPTRYTPEDLLKMPDGDRYELVDGQLVEHTMSLWSSYVAGR